MNHKFVASGSAPAECVKCKFDVMAHGEFGRCQQCNKFPTVVNIVEDYLMCPSCEFSEMQARQEAANRPAEIPEPIKRIEEERFNSPAAQIENIVKSNGGSALADLPMSGDEFFNAETIAILELEKKINADANIPANEKSFFFVREMQERHKSLSVTLVEGIKLVVEIRSRDQAVNRALNLTASKLRADEKAKLKIQDINYVPKEAPKKVTARMTQKDRTIESIAKTMYAPRNAQNKIVWDELPSEQRQDCLNKARQLFANNFSTISAAAKIVDEATTNKGE